jgi:hypothetical protein
VTDFRGLLLLLTVVAAVTLPAGPSGADTVARRDRRDTPGPLDVVRVEHSHAPRNEKVVTHTVWTTGRWGKKDLRNKNSHISFWFSTDGDGYAEHRILVSTKDGRLTAAFHDYVEGSDFAGVGPSTYLRWTRPSRRSIRVFLHRKHLAVDEYRWSVETLYRKSSSRCRFGRPTCQDKAPGGRGRGRIDHSLR